MRKIDAIAEFGQYKPGRGQEAVLEDNKPMGISLSALE